MKRKLTIGLLFTLALAVCTTNLMAAEAWSESTEIQKSVKVSGTVKDSAGEPIFGATVIQVGSQTNGMTTDANGNFTLTVPEGAEVSVSYIGYVAQTVKAYDGMIVTLADDSQTIDDVVVVGFGTQKKVNVTGAVTSVDVDKTFGSKPIADVSKGLQGTVPGLNIAFSSGDLGESASIKIRGTGSLNGANKPLILLDGVEIDDISFVNPDNIANISVLKDAASASIYGTRAAFGVVLITSKDGSELKDNVRISYSTNLAWNQAINQPRYNTGYSVLDEMDAAMLGQKNVNGADIEAFGMYYKDLKPKIKDWLDNYLDDYQSGALGEEYVYGRDYEYDASGIAQFYRVSDPNKEMYKDAAFQHTHNFSIAGNSGKTNYNISLSYNKQDGMFKKAQEHYLQRVTANISTNTQLYKWLNVGTKVMYTEKMLKFPRGYAHSASSGGMIYYNMRFPTFFPYGISDGGHAADVSAANAAKAESGKGWYFRHGNGFIAYAPTWKSTDDFMRIGANVKIDLAKGLSFYGDYTRGQLNYLQKGVEQPEYAANWWSAFSPKAAVRSNDRLENTWLKKRTNTVNAYFDYVFTVCNDHNFAVKVGFNAEDLTYNSNYLRSDKLYSSNIPTMNMTENANGKAYVDETLKKMSSAGFFARINYNWKEKWLVELNGRYDGSSQFKVGDKWAFFPSASIGYRMSEEPFMKDQNVISNLKFRASYGSIGNQSIGSNWYQFVQTISDATADWILSDGNLAAAMGMPSIVGTKMQWERINTIDAGFDIGFFNGDLNVVFDWFQRENVGMLIARNQVPAVGGFPSLPKENTGNLRTRGWELQIDYAHSFNKDFRIYATATLADSKAKITKFTSTTGSLTSNYVGKELGEIWGFETVGYFSADHVANGVETAQGNKSIYDYQGKLQKGSFKYGEGDIMYRDLDGDGVVSSKAGTIDDHGDLKRIGNTTPRYEYSLRAGLEWKGLDFEFLLQGVGKRDMWTRSSLFLPFADGTQMSLFNYQMDYYTPDNTDAKYPRPYWGQYSGTINGLSNYTGCNNYYPQTKYLVDLAYLRVKNITVGYTLPQNWTKKAYIQKARIYFSVQNPLTFDNMDGIMDPETVGGWNTTGAIDTAYAGRTQPNFRTWSCGLQLTF